ncbi:MAG: tRNA preQ1(34) S-adenosylmethionine ribosyltransferase-isomerase QueA [Puniceicoccales bacterium]|jgi:S-adenosylmethionine:tRNA ribosyltransferase-isomerase|nr:tRNA preQ1(34) S-adenosylmethionine ribosyltransferase-isomerase QueA [Puniceicoccales bacterium]
MDSALFDYELPESCIAYTPAARRDESRLLVVDRKTRAVTHRIFRDLPDLLPLGTTLFRNNAKVLRARLPGMRPTGGKVECLLLRPAESPEVWWCLLKPGKKAADAAGFGWLDAYRAKVVEQRDSEYRVHFDLPEGKSILSVADEIGALPLPPYIEKARPADGTDFSMLDRERYQTIYADPRQPVAAAAPTAGLHFSTEVLSALAARSFETHDLTLHVGLGTFQPIKSEKIEDHPIHREWYEIPFETRRALLTSSPRLAVGTTSLRAMEDYARKTKDEPAPLANPSPFASEANLFIYPPSRFLGAELLLTNFHLPRSTLMCLVSAFLTPGDDTGIGWLKELYNEAIAQGYRFYSYGDAMLIL